MHSKEDDINWWAEFQIIKCLGCDTISFRKVSSSSEDFNPNTGEEILYVDLYPNSELKREMMKDYYYFPQKIRKIYSETIEAINNKLLLLSAVGLRMLIEAICLEEKVVGLNLKSRIYELVIQGLLSKTQADFLHHLRFLGNDAAHEIIAPKPERLIAALDIAETLLKTIYLLPKIAEDIGHKK